MKAPVAGLELTGFPEPVAECARETQVDLARWAGQYPSFDPTPFSGLVLTTAVHVPTWSRPKRLLAAIVSAWILTFDGMVDEGRIPESEQASRLAAYKAVIRRDTPTSPLPKDDLSQALRDIRERMAAYPSSAALFRHWESSFDQMVDAIVWHHHAASALRGMPDRAGMHRPSYEALIERALHSIGVPFYLATCFILHEDPTIEERLPGLIEIGEECALAIRLANDLRTWEREEIEQTINTVMVLRHDILRENPGIGPAESRNRAIQVLKDRELASIARTHRLLACSPRSSSPVETGIGRLVTYVTGYYALQDYRTFSQRG